MKLKEAIELGKALGLETPEEAINNVLIHSLNLFKYEDIPKELHELIVDAKGHGIEFCPICGAAMINGKCYMRRIKMKAGTTNSTASEVKEMKVMSSSEVVFKTFHGKKWHICKESDAFGPTSWCGINDMWRWVEEARMDQVPAEEICKICLRKRMENEEKE